MHTLIRTLTVAGTLVVPLGSLAQAPEREIPRTSGKVLVMESERIMEGDIEREGDRYRIRRQASETWVPADNVRLVCDSLDEVYQSMRSRANLRDTDELLKLARWGIRYGLREQARQDVQAILNLRPQHAEGQRLWKTLQKPATTPANVTPVAAQEVENSPLQPAGLPLEAQGLFSTKIQVILMNACASCHAAGRGGDFKLLRAYHDGSSNLRATQHNIAAAVARINPDDCQLSPLLIKAVTAHGDTAKPPLKNRQHPAFRLLEDWVRQVAADMPRRTSHVAIAGTSKAPETPAPLSERTIFAATPVPASRDSAKPQTPTKPPESPAKEAAPPSTGPVDPFDPAWFNQQDGRTGR